MSWEASATADAVWTSRGFSGYVVKPLVRAALQEALARAAPPGAEPSRAMRVLLTDDSADSRMLVAAFLKGTAVELDVAVNGAEAVEKTAAARYDAVLMDIEMPVMDGLTATRTIRERERSNSVPPVAIIALTAHGAEPPAARTDAPGGLQALVPQYLSSRAKDLARMRAGLAAGEFAVIQRIGHNLKGTGKPYGFPEITRLGAAIEEAAKSGDSAELERHVAGLEAYLGSLG